MPTGVPRIDPRPSGAKHAHHEFGRHLAIVERSPLDLDRTEHLGRARSTFEALGCRTDPTGQTGTGGPI
jgi:hypothetical protein